MGCNKNLTDDQLEAMFTEIDEKMWQIEQTNGIFHSKNQTQMQEVYQIFLKRSCTQSIPLRTSHQKREIPPLQ